MDGTFALTLDCRGMRCPGPIIELARRIGEVPLGGDVLVLADDPAAGPDLAAWCRMTRNALVESGVEEYVVRRER